MLDAAVMRRPQFATSVDVGVLAEALLFYQKIHLVLDHGSLVTIGNTIGFDNLIRLISDGHVTASFIKQMLAVHTNAGVHGLLSFQTMGMKGDDLTKDQRIYQAVRQVVKKPSKARQVARKLNEMIKSEYLKDDDRNVEEILDYARNDLRDTIMLTTRRGRFCSIWRQA